jgi:hypothetical protein
MREVLRHIIVGVGFTALVGGGCLSFAGLTFDAVAPQSPRAGGERPGTCCARTGADQTPIPPLDRLHVRLAPVTKPPVSTTGPWASPLYPQNHVTLWDRIRASTQDNVWAFLLGSAIQLHAPETAATPGPRLAQPAATIGTADTYLGQGLWVSPPWSSDGTAHHDGRERLLHAAWWPYQTRGEATTSWSAARMATATAEGQVCLASACH